MSHTYRGKGACTQPARDSRTTRAHPRLMYTPHAADAHQRVANLQTFANRTWMIRARLLYRVAGETGRRVGVTRRVSQGTRSTRMLLGSPAPECDWTRRKHPGTTRDLHDSQGNRGARDAVGTQDGGYHAGIPSTGFSASLTSTIQFSIFLPQGLTHVLNGTCPGGERTTDSKRQRGRLR